VFHSHHIVPLKDNLHLDESSTDRHLVDGIRAFLIAPANAQDKPIYSSPTLNEIKLLRSALDAVYGDKNPAKALPLLSDAINAWENKAPDERAALYRVRGDCLLVCICTCIDRLFVVHPSIVLSNLDKYCHIML
jgi:hypothetical protein